MQPTFASEYASYYHEHWWFRAREAILLRELERLPLRSHGRVLDVGCGNGLLLPKLARWGEAYGIEVDAETLDDEGPARDRLYNDPLEHPRYDSWAGAFQLITALDVIEHIENDGQAVARMVELLEPGGHLVMTAPAFDCLWDVKHDVVNEHWRRYRLSQLKARCAAYADVERARYLFPSLFLPKWLMACANRLRREPADQLRAPSRFSKVTMTAWLCAEDALTRWLPVPVGSSVLVIARKPEAPSPAVVAPRRAEAAEV